jgi:hypothetical protein
MKLNCSSNSPSYKESGEVSNPPGVQRHSAMVHQRRQARRILPTTCVRCSVSLVSCHRVGKLRPFERGGHGFIMPKIGHAFVVTSVQ